MLSRDFIKDNVERFNRNIDRYILSGKTAHSYIYIYIYIYLAGRAA